ncbi:hypothetical protein M0802_008143 [Mischocyttarus mexicanus]|nr:hypothetical protein M0802_008143 [Mischocyttarus mexicanus]
MTERVINNPISKPVELGLYFIGLWPKYTYSIIHRLLWVIILGIVLILEYRYVLLHITTDDLAELMDCFSITVSNSLLFIKLIILWFKQRTFNEIVAMMNEDWLECITIGRNVDMMTSKIFIAHKFSKISTIIYGGGVIMFLIPVIFADERIFVLKMEFPFDATVSPFYELINMIQFLQEVTFASASGMLNGVMMTMILHTGGQVEIMCQAMEEFMNQIDERGSCLNVLKKLIAKHDRIILFSGYIEELFTYIALLQFFSNTMAICFSGFVIMTSIGTEEGNAILAKTVPYYTVVNVEAFILCFAGEYLSSKSLIIGQKAYDTNWYDLKPNESKYILFLMLRAQRQLTITVGKFLDLSLESFASDRKIEIKFDDTNSNRPNKQSRRIELTFYGNLARLCLRDNMPSILGELDVFDFSISILVRCGKPEIRSPLYEIVNLDQFVLLLFATSSSSMLSALLVTLVLHVDGQVEIIRRELSEISVMAKQHVSCKKMLRSSIFRHQKIISFTDNLENVFTYIALIQFLSNTIVICALGFVIVTSLNTDQRYAILSKIGPYYILANIEAFVLCFAGEFLRAKSSIIERAIYDTAWYELDPIDSRILLFLLIRSQKRFAITAGKFMDMSLEGFASMLKASGSYLSVLYAMY